MQLGQPWWMRPKGDTNGMTFFVVFWFLVFVRKNLFSLGLYPGFFLTLDIKQFGSILTGQQNCVVRSGHKQI